MVCFTRYKGVLKSRFTSPNGATPISTTPMPFFLISLRTLFLLYPFLSCTFARLSIHTHTYTHRKGNRVVLATGEECAFTRPTLDWARLHVKEY